MRKELEKGLRSIDDVTGDLKITLDDQYVATSATKHARGQDVKDAKTSEVWAGVLSRNPSGSGRSIQNEDSAKAELLRLHRSKSWIRKEIDRWNIEFETREGRKATKEEKAQVEEKYVAYKAIKSRMSSLAQQIIHLN